MKKMDEYHKQRVVELIDKYDATEAEKRELFDIHNVYATKRMNFSRCGSCVNRMKKALRELLTNNQ